MFFLSPVTISCIQEPSVSEHIISARVWAQSGGSPLECISAEGSRWYFHPAPGVTAPRVIICSNTWTQPAAQRRYYYTAHRVSLAVTYFVLTGSAQSLGAEALLVPQVYKRRATLHTHTHTNTFCRKMGTLGAAGALCWEVRRKVYCLAKWWLNLNASADILHF